MKSLTKHLWFHTKSRREYINITGEVEKLLKESGIKEGLCLVNAMHITASVYINDDERGLIHDFDEFLEDIIKHRLQIHVVAGQRDAMTRLDLVSSMNSPGIGDN